MSPNKPHFGIFKNQKTLFWRIWHDDGNNLSSILSLLMVTSPYLATTKINSEDYGFFFQVFEKTHIQSCAFYLLFNLLHIIRAITLIMKSIALRWAHDNRFTLQLKIGPTVVRKLFKTIAHAVWRFLVSTYICICLFVQMYTCLLNDLLI